MGEGKDPHRKIGWMIRESDKEDAAHMTATVHGDGLTVLQWRRLRGAYMRDPQDEIFNLKKLSIISKIIQILHYQRCNIKLPTICRRFSYVVVHLFLREITSFL